ncbi:hypothetical protein [Aquimarina algiphila]|uniref:Uncharacterized protein n=1 Tax=Aquimarina algiphila TaxID=2047982 RepID=A0A554VFB8_9FLAO|nr:hypothetical protein [Aquimarina algiphila]TSE05826.1 hypothetical protein FOF46_21555 [Aquimarina algiphila]
MKKLVLVSIVVLGSLFVSCEKSSINEEITEFELQETDKGDIVRPGDDPGSLHEVELYKVDKGDIIRPGDRPN